MSESFFKKIEGMTKDDLELYVEDQGSKAFSPPQVQIILNKLPQLFILFPESRKDLSVEQLKRAVQAVPAVLCDIHKNQQTDAMAESACASGCFMIRFVNPELPCYYRLAMEALKDPSLDRRSLVLPVSGFFEDNLKLVFMTRFTEALTSYELNEDNGLNQFSLVRKHLLREIYNTQSIQPEKLDELITLCEVMRARSIELDELVDGILLLQGNDKPHKRAIFSPLLECF